MKDDDEKLEVILRPLLAALAMHGFLVAEPEGFAGFKDYGDLADNAVKCADAVIAALEER